MKIAVVHIMYVEHDLVTDASSPNGKFERIFLFCFVDFCSSSMSQLTVE